MSDGFGVLEPRIHHLSFSGPNMAFSSSQKIMIFKGEMAKFEAKNTTKQGKRKKDKWYPFHACKGDPCRRAKPGRFGSLAFAIKNRHFGGECSWILVGKARKCGRFWVFACVPNPGKQSIWRQCPPSARKQSTKKLPNRPGFTHVQGTPARPTPFTRCQA